MTLAGLIGGAVALGGVIFVAQFVAGNWSDLPEVDLSGVFTLVLVGCLFLYVSCVLGNGLAWLLMIRSTGVSVTGKFALSVFLISQYGKYVPGNVWHFVSRASLSATGAIHPAQSSYVMIVETMIVAIIGVMLSLIALSAGEIGWLAGANNLAIAGFLIGFMLLLCAPKWILAAARRTWELVKQAPMPISIGAPRRSVVIVAALLACLGLVVNAFILQLLGDWLLGDSVSPSWLSLIGAFALAWTTGFITPGAPGGVGVRDGLLVSLLIPIYGPAGAVAVALAHRILSIVGDTIALGLGVILKLMDGRCSRSR